MLASDGSLQVCSAGACGRISLQSLTPSTPSPHFQAHLKFGNEVSLPHPVALECGVWNDVVVTYSGRQLSLIVNGEAASCEVNTSDPPLPVVKASLFPPFPLWAFLPNMHVSFVVAFHYRNLSLMKSQTVKSKDPSFSSAKHSLAVVVPGAVGLGEPQLGIACCVGRNLLTLLFLPPPHRDCV